MWWVEDGSPHTWLSYFGVKMFHEFKVRGLIFFSGEKTSSEGNSKWQKIVLEIFRAVTVLLK